MATEAQKPKFEFGAPLWLGQENASLAYYSFNPDGAETILFLHCAMTGAPEWDLVLPHIPNTYHLLVPDIPLHNHSKDMKLEKLGIDTGNALGDLVKACAKNGRAHIVGLSMGAHIGRRLAVQRPEVVKTCFLSGYKEFDYIPFKNILLYFVFAIESFGAYIPKSWIDDIEIKLDTATPKNLAQFKKVFGMLMDTEDVRGKSWSARTLVVAASKGGLIPTNDNIKDAKDLAGLARKENAESRVVQNRSMRHAWSRQDPELFARAVVCWIEERPLPQGFEKID